MIHVESVHVPKDSMRVTNFDISIVAFELATPLVSRVISDSSFIQLDRRNTVAIRRIFFIKKGVKKYSL